MTQLQLQRQRQVQALAWGTAESSMRQPTGSGSDATPGTKPECLQRPPAHSLALHTLGSPRAQLYVAETPTSLSLGNFVVRGEMQAAIAAVGPAHWAKAAQEEEWEQMDGSRCRCSGSWQRGKDQRMHSHQQVLESHSSQA